MATMDFVRFAEEGIGYGIAALLTEAYERGFEDAIEEVACG